MRYNVPMSDIRKRLKRRWRGAVIDRTKVEIAPDEIFLDSSNLPDLDTQQFEGRFELPISKKTLIAIGALFTVVMLIFGSKLWSLQITYGEMHANRSENNRLHHTIVFSDRGIINDRNSLPIAWNEVNPENSEFSLRRYADISGLSHVVGFIKYPSKDTSGFYYQEDFVGKDGVEEFYNDHLRGENGLKIVETDAFSTVQSSSTERPPHAGQSLTLSIDAKLQHAIYEAIGTLVRDVGFTGGAAILMDIRNGEVIANVSYPEYDSEILADGRDTEKIEGYFQNKNNPFLDRVTNGLYTPGSIVKPYLALGALNEKVIKPEDSILSTGSISIPNPYVKDTFTVFKDWKAHGWVNMRQAIAVSSDVYFYEVGGGFEGQKGIGISNIEKYIRMFGFGSSVKAPFFEGAEGVIPNPEWKKQVFNGEQWTIGNTYHTAIGQYGFQVTPLQVVRAVGALATGGVLRTPTILKVDSKEEIETIRTINIPQEYFKVVQEGMRDSVLYGTAKALDVPYIKIAGKTGTAELGALKQFVNSWTVGYFPYEEPHYAFALLMEKGPVKNLVGASAVMRQVIDWMQLNTPEYFK